MTLMHSWIRFWLKRDDHKFAEYAKHRDEFDQGVADSGVLPDVLEMCAGYDQNLHDRNQFPVGAFFDSIDEHGGRKPTAERLFVVAEVGADLFYTALCTPDNDDNKEFFVQAYDRWGALVDTALQECDLPHRNVMTGEVAE